jgi:hypothetical protein
VRKAFLSNQYKGLSGDINYALVLGNVIHEIFQDILQQMDFRHATIEKTIQSAIKGQILLLYSLGKKYEEVLDDSRRAVKNITEWLDLVLKGSKNQFGL